MTQDLNRSAVELEGTTLLDYDASNNPIYIGEAGIGVSSSEAKWRIQKLTYDVHNNVTAIQWAQGSNRYDKVWDLRATYTYS
jgi:YD repeat-containing protein